jgi:hypothetical protein
MKLIVAVTQQDKFDAVRGLLVGETVSANCPAPHRKATQPSRKGSTLVIAVDEWIPIRGREPRFTPAAVR